MCSTKWIWHCSPPPCCLLLTEHNTINILDSTPNPRTWSGCIQSKRESQQYHDKQENSNHDTCFPPRSLPSPSPATVRPPFFCGLSQAGELGSVPGCERKPKPFSGLLSSLRLSYGESNKPRCGFKGHPLHNALAPSTRHWVPDRRMLSRRQGGTYRPWTCGFRTLKQCLMSPLCWRSAVWFDLQQLQ